MIAAICARKRTEQAGVADHAKSVTRQVESATAYARRKGWIVDPAHVYQDDGISGAEFVKRPGFLRLMNALKPAPPFQVLIMSEESRLGEGISSSWTFRSVSVIARRACMQFFTSAARYGETVVEAEAVEPSAKVAVRVKADPGANRPVVSAAKRTAEPPAARGKLTESLEVFRRGPSREVATPRTQ
jgi:hypothetical protein